MNDLFFYFTGKTAETTTTSIVTSASVRSLVPPRPTTTTGSIPLTAAPSNFSCYQNETLLLNHFNRRRFKSGPCPPTSACLLLSGRVNSILSFSRLSGKYSITVNLKSPTKTKYIAFCTARLLHATTLATSSRCCRKSHLRRMCSFVFVRCWDVHHYGEES